MFLQFLIFLGQEFRFLPFDDCTAASTIECLGSGEEKKPMQMNKKK